MQFNLCLVWENINLLAGGKTAHHKTNINMAMKLENGDLASNAKENMSVFSLHFHKVLNNQRPVNKAVLELITQKPCLTDIDTLITFREVKHAINKLEKGKAPGLNDIPPEALKAMDNAPKRTIHNHVSDLFDGKTDHDAWRKSQCVPVPKKGDLSDPKKWRGIMLMDMCSKVFSSVMTARAFKLNVKRYLINYPHLFDYVQTIFCLSFPSRDRATALGRYEQFYFTKHVPYPQKIHFEDAIRSEDPVQLCCNSFCVQHKMVGDDYPSILQCLVYCHSAD
jgi:hypothetical protein